MLNCSKKECPQCRIAIGSKRYLRNDHKLAFIIGTLIKDIDAFNKQEEVNRKNIVKKTYDFSFQKQMYEERLQQQERLAKMADSLVS